MGNDATCRVELLDHRLLEALDERQAGQALLPDGLGRKQPAAERSKWEAFSRAMALILNPIDQEAQ